MHKIRLIALATGALLIGPGAAFAQTTEPDTVFVNVNAGAQLQSHSITASSSFPIYGQTAFVNSAQAIETGPFFDLSVGARVWGDLGVAVGYSSFKNASDVVGNAIIPHPLFFNRDATIEFTTGADHREQNISIVAVWFFPVIERLDLAFSAGPSFTRVQQGTFGDLIVPAGSQDGFPVIVEEEGWAKGASVGVDATYLLTPRYALFGDAGMRAGLGMFVRYNGGSVTLPSDTEVNAGGFQLGGGIRLRF